MHEHTHEEWRPVPGYEGIYEVSSLGRVLSVRLGRTMTPRKHSGGYRAMMLSRNGVRWQVLLHRLVALTFLGDPPSPEHEIAHWNGDKTDNRLCNIRWATHDENMADTIRHGRSNLGKDFWRPRLSVEQVIEIKRSLTEGVPATRIARDQGLNVKTVYNISQRKSWAHVDWPPTPDRRALARLNF